MVKRILLLLLCLGVFSAFSRCSVNLSPSGLSFNEGHGRGAYYGESDRGDAERRSLERDRTYQLSNRPSGYGDLN